MFLPRKQYIKTVISLVLAVSLQVQPLMVPFVMAEEALPSPEASPSPTVEPSSSAPIDPTPNPDPLNTPDPTPEPSPSPEPTVSPEPSPSPEPTVSPESSPSPEPIASPEPSPSIDPSPSPNPEAVANIVSDVVASTLPNPEPQPESSPSPTPEVIALVNQNTASTSATMVAEATTGNNVLDSLNQAELTTGSSLSIADLLQILNLNLISSQFQILTITITPDMIGDVNVNDLWQQFMANSATATQSANLSLTSLQAWLIANQNELNLNANVAAAATTGSNAVAGATAAAVTGDATAIATAVNVGNANLINSNLVITVINILPGATANLILPRPELFSGATTSPFGLLNMVNLNSALIEADITTTATTGQNTEIGSSTSMSTGNSISITNNLSFVNLNLIDQMWFYWLFNLPESETATITGWDTPSTGSVISGSTLNQITASTNPTASSLCAIGTCPDLIINQNTASVTAQVSATANTGSNLVMADRMASLVTGTATTVANLLNFINLNLFNTNWLMGLTNIIGSWTGKVMYAYPDVAVSLGSIPETTHPGEDFTANVQYLNQGDDLAHQVVVSLNLPPEISYLSDNAEVATSVRGQQITWTLTDVPAHQQGSFNVHLKTTALHAAKPSLMNRLIPQAFATDSSNQVLVNAVIYTSDPESNTFNNSASGTIRITDGTVETAEAATDTNQPELTITSSNNVNQYVYQGDTVTFEVKLSNKGAGRSEDTLITHTILKSDGEVVGNAQFTVGTVEAAKTGTLRFGIVIPQTGTYPPGSYVTKTSADGYAPDGTHVFSNTATTSFNVRARGQTNVVKVPQAQAAPPSLGQVLGTTCPECKSAETMFPYLLLIILSALWFITKKRSIPVNFTQKWQKILWYSGTTLAYLFVLSTFFFSLYHIGTYYGFLTKIPVLGATLDHVAVLIQ